ncbi:uncharacterized protein LOC123872753 isoform X1 [Maniola jurtina]|uniref:uncharacterized protein LOC123872753 isoform X1 n=1 Tax=Maniola jurtina TaxID=191418 RepID=UPI001E686647|nr:uncharacterized protein LOC123872753 isoform X1 [Maniola jurtina]
MAPATGARMAEKTVSFNTHCNLYESQLESIARWLSCNGEVWGMGPTAVFASAAALFLYNELEATVFIAGDHGRVSLLEKTLVSTMVLGMLALMIHLWVCSMRFFQYYLDTLIKDSPSMLLEMTTASLLGKNELIALGPLTRFLKLQQPQIHITVCWFLSLCYADYVRKHYCQRFNMPYLEQWQAELHERASRGVSSTVARVNSFVGAVHQRLRGFRQEPLTNDAHTVACSMHASSVEVRRASSHVSHEWVSLGAKRSQQVCARLVGQSSDTVAAAIEKLQTFVAETRCSCNIAPNARECASCPSVLSYQEDLLRKPTLEGPCRVDLAS